MTIKDAKYVLENYNEIKDNPIFKAYARGDTVEIFNNDEWTSLEEELKIGLLLLRPELYRIRPCGVVYVQFNHYGLPNRVLTHREWTQEPDNIRNTFFKFTNQSSINYDRP